MSNLNPKDTNQCSSSYIYKDGVQIKIWVPIAKQPDWAGLTSSELAFVCKIHIYIIQNTIFVGVFDHHRLPLS